MGIEELDSVVNFAKNKYTVVEQGLHPDVAALISQYVIFQAFQHPEVEPPEGTVPNTQAVYGDPLMESLMLSLKPIVEEATGLSLWPTYSYHRLYKPGDELRPHTDRPSNEVTVTIHFGANYIHVDPEYKWPISVDGYEAKQKPGDMLIYRGTELSHWRTPFEGEKGSWHTQAFFGYVDANGPYTFCRYDARPNIGYPKETRNETFINFAMELMEKNKEVKVQNSTGPLFLTND